MPNNLENTISDIISPSVVDMGYDIVRIKLWGKDNGKVLQIMIERKDGAVLQVEDCENVSRRISLLLEVDDPISGAYNLEVSSPGIDRPLVRQEDFVRFSGFETKIEAKRAINGRKRFRGILKGHSDGVVTIEVDGEFHEIDYELISDAKLILNDDLIKAYEGGHFDGVAV